jgi:hypothetical protein
VWCKTCGGFVRIPEEEPEAEVAKPVYAIAWRSKDESAEGIVGAEDGDEAFTYDDEKQAESDAEVMCAGNPEKRFWVEEVEPGDVTAILTPDEPTSETAEEWVIEREKGGIVPGVFGSHEAAQAAGDTLLKEHSDWGYIKIRKRTEKDKMPESPAKAEAPAPETKAEDALGDE